MPFQSDHNDHLAEDCTDEFCTRLPCRMYKGGRDRGYREGFDDGYVKGFLEGEAAGYSAGFAAGLAAGGE